MGSQSSAEDADWIVATVAMPRILDAFGPQEDIHARAIERRPEGIRVQRLTPLAVCFLVAMGAIPRVGESPRLDKFVAFDRGVSWRGEFVFTEKEAVGSAYVGGVLFARAVCVLRLQSAAHNKNAERATERLQNRHLLPRYPSRIPRQSRGVKIILVP